MPLSALVAIAFLNAPGLEADSIPASGNEHGNLVDAACNDIARVAEELPGLSISQIDGTVHDDKTDLDFIGCRIAGGGSGIAYRDDKWPHDFLRNRMLADDWREDISRAADGSGSTAFAIRKGAVLCVFSAIWIISEPFDPDAAEATRYKLDVGCYARPDAN